VGRIPGTNYNPGGVPGAGGWVGGWFPSVDWTLVEHSPGDGEKAKPHREPNTTRPGYFPRGKRVGRGIFPAPFGYNPPHPGRVFDTRNRTPDIKHPEHREKK